MRELKVGDRVRHQDRGELGEGQIVGANPFHAPQVEVKWALPDPHTKERVMHHDTAVLRRIPLPSDEPRAPAGRAVACQNCDWKGVEDEAAELERNYRDEIEAGDEMPAGVCPECGCAAMLVGEAPKLAVADLQRIKAACEAGETVANIGEMLDELIADHAVPVAHIQPAALVAKLGDAQSVLVAMHGRLESGLESAAALENPNKRVFLQALFEIVMVDRDAVARRVTESLNIVEAHADGTGGDYHLNEYRTWQAYGGPEEGGWWYDAGEFVKCHGRYTTQIEAWNAHRGIALKSGDHTVVVENHDGESFPAERPVYS